MIKFASSLKPYMYSESARMGPNIRIMYLNSKMSRWGGCSKNIHLLRTWIRWPLSELNSWNAFSHFSNHGKLGYITLDPPYILKGYVNKDWWTKWSTWMQHSSSFLRGNVNIHFNHLEFPEHLLNTVFFNRSFDHSMGECIFILVANLPQLH